MNIFLRYPEKGKEVKLSLNGEDGMKELNNHLVTLFGFNSDSFILLNSEGVSLKDRSIKSISTDTIYAFLKESIKNEKHEIECEFQLIRTKPLLPLEGEDRGVLLIEKALYKLYQRSLEHSDFFKSYASFVDQLESQVQIINCAKSVLQLYHNKHIKDQVDAFDYLYKKNLSHFETAKQEVSHFEESVNKLHEFKIHYRLKSDNKEYLSDLIDIQQLAKWKESYIAEVERLQIKFEELESMIAQLGYTFQLPVFPNLVLNYHKVTEIIQVAANFSIEAYLDYRALCEKYNTTGDANAGKRLHEENWEKKVQQAQFHMNYIEKNLEDYKISLKDLRTQRIAANSQLFVLLRKITEFAARIRDSIKSQLSMLSSLLKRSEKRLAFIRVPKLLPEAHDSTISEISRRNHFVIVASELQKKLSSLIEIEISERMAFLEKFRHVLPNNFVPQLSAAPFIKIITDVDDSDLELPKINDPIPEEFPYKHRYCVGEGEKNETLAEENTMLAQKLEKVTQEFWRLEARMNEALREKDHLSDRLQEAEFRSDDLMNKCKKAEQVQSDLKSQTTEMEREVTENLLRIAELENRLKKNEETARLSEKILQSSEEKAKRAEERCRELEATSDKCKRLEETIIEIKMNEIKLRTENECIKGSLTKLTADVKEKEKVIADTVDQLSLIYKEFEAKEQQVENLTKRLSDEKSANENLLKQSSRPSNPELENICKSLGLQPSLNDLASYIRVLKEADSAKISFTSFTEGSLALFFPTSEGQFLAFNYNCPDHYLNVDSLSGASVEAVLSQPYIVGLIIEKKKLVAGKSNPLFLPPGKEFYLLSIKEQPSY